MSDFAKALKKVETKTTKTVKKDDKPVVDGSDEMKTAVDDLVAAKANKKKAEAVIKKSESVILPKCQERQDSDALEMRHSKSYRVLGHNEVSTYVTQDRFTVSGDDEENLVNLYGQDGFDERFEKNKSLTATNDIFTDEDLQNEVMEKLGEDLFARLFVYKETLKTKKGFDVLQYKENAPALEDARVFVKQYKAALR